VATRHSILAILVGVLVAVAIVVITLPAPVSNVLPTAWSAASRSCNPCAVTSNAQDVFELDLVNITSNGTFNYLLNAYNWSTGDEAWPSVGLGIGDGFAFFQSGQQLAYAALFADAGAVAVVAIGNSASVAGQSGSLNSSAGACVVWVLEWNSSAGSALPTQQSDSSVGCGLPQAYVTASDGWIAVATLSPFAANVRLSTFPLGPASPAYEAWSTNVSLLPSPPPEVLFAAISLSGGVVSLSTMGLGARTAVLNGSSGRLIWEGAIPDLYTVPESTNSSAIPQTEGLPRYIVQAGGSFYFIGNDTAGVFLDRFDYSTNMTASLANLTGRIDPLNCQLTLTTTGVLVVTDAWNEHYWAYSTAGSPLWNLSLSLRQTSSTGATNVGGIDFSPVQAGGDLLIGSVFSWSSSNYENNNYPSSTWTVPLALVSSSTGVVSWRSSYTQTETLGPNAFSPETYLPMVAQGPFVAFIYYPGSGLGWTLTVAHFS